MGRKKSERKLRKQAERPGRAGFHARSTLMDRLITSSKEADRTSREKVATIGAKSRTDSATIQGRTSRNVQSIENTGDMAVRELIEAGAAGRQTASDKAASGRVEETGKQRRKTFESEYESKLDFYKKLDLHNDEKKKKKGIFNYNPDSDELDEENSVQKYIEFKIE